MKLVTFAVGLVLGLVLCQAKPAKVQDEYDYCAEENLPQKRIVCFYDNTFNKYYGIDDVNPCLCTHLVYSHVTFDPANNWTLVAQQKSSEDYKQFNGLKKKNPWLMTMVSVISGPTNDVTAEGTDHKIAAENIVKFIGENHLDGIDIDLQGMSSGSPVADYVPRKSGLSSFIQMLRETMNDGLAEDEDPFLLSLTVSKNPHEMVYGYDINNAVKHVDFFNLPAYNFTNSSQAEVKHPSRLHGISDIENADSLVDLLLTLGAPSHKLVIGAPTNGYTYTLKNESLIQTGSPISGAGRAGDISNTAGILTQEEICQNRHSNDWTMGREKDQTAPFMYNGDQWVGFEDEMSIKLKTKYVVLRELGGIMLSSTSSDDYKGHCGMGKYPLISGIHDVFTGRKSEYSNMTDPFDEYLAESRIVTVVDKNSGAHNVLPPPHADTVGHLQCTRQGYYRNPYDCTKFYRCVKFNQLTDEFTTFEYDCPHGLVFDERYEVCSWPSWSPPCDGSTEVLPVPRSDFVCPSHGYHRDPENCRWFYYCADLTGNGYLDAWEFKCPFDLAFDNEKVLCNWKWLVPGCSESYAGEYAHQYGPNHDLNVAPLKPKVEDLAGQYGSSVGYDRHGRLVGNGRYGIFSSGGRYDGGRRYGYDGGAHKVDRHDFSGVYNNGRYEHRYNENRDNSGAYYGGYGDTGKSYTGGYGDNGKPYVHVAGLDGGFGSGGGVGPGGPAGPKGPAGPGGPTGPAGPAGPYGPHGPHGGYPKGKNAYTILTEQGPKSVLVTHGSARPQPETKNSKVVVFDKVVETIKVPSHICKVGGCQTSTLYVHDHNGGKHSGSAEYGRKSTEKVHRSHDYGKAQRLPGYKVYEEKHEYVPQYTIRGGYKPKFGKSYYPTEIKHGHQAKVTTGQHGGEQAVYIHRGQIHRGGASSGGAFHGTQVHRGGASGGGAFKFTQVHAGGAAGGAEEVRRGGASGGGAFKFTQVHGGGAAGGGEEVRGGGASGGGAFKFTQVHGGGAAGGEEVRRGGASGGGGAFKFTQVHGGGAAGGAEEVHSGGASGGGAFQVTQQQTSFGGRSENQQGQGQVNIKLHDLSQPTKPSRSTLGDTTRPFPDDGKYRPNAKYTKSGYTSGQGGRGRANVALERLRLLNEQRQQQEASLQGVRQRGEQGIVVNRNEQGGGGGAGGGARVVVHQGQGGSGGQVVRQEQVQKISGGGPGKVNIKLHDLSKATGGGERHVVTEEYVHGFRGHGQGHQYQTHKSNAKVDIKLHDLSKATGGSAGGSSGVHQGGYAVREEYVHGGAHGEGHRGYKESNAKVNIKLHDLSKATGGGQRVEGGQDKYFVREYVHGSAHGEGHQGYKKSNAKVNIKLHDLSKATGGGQQVEGGHEGYVVREEYVHGGAHGEGHQGYKKSNAKVNVKLHDLSKATGGGQRVEGGQEGYIVREEYLHGVHGEGHGYQKQKSNAKVNIKLHDLSKATGGGSEEGHQERYVVRQEYVHGGAHGEGHQGYKKSNAKVNINLHDLSKATGGGSEEGHQERYVVRQEYVHGGAHGEGHQGYKKSNAKVNIKLHDLSKATGGGQRVEGGQERYVVRQEYVHGGAHGEGHQGYKKSNAKVNIKHHDLSKATGGGGGYEVREEYVYGPDGHRQTHKKSNAKVNIKLHDLSKATGGSQEGGQEGGQERYIYREEYVHGAHGEGHGVQKQKSTAKVNIQRHDLSKATGSGSQGGHGQYEYREEYVHGSRGQGQQKKTSNAKVNIKLHDLSKATGGAAVVGGGQYGSGYEVHRQVIRTRHEQKTSTNVHRESGGYESGYAFGHSEGQQKKVSNAKVNINLHKFTGGAGGSATTGAEEFNGDFGSRQEVVQTTAKPTTTTRATGDRGTAARPTTARQFDDGQYRPNEKYTKSGYTSGQRARPRQQLQDGNFGQRISASGSSTSTSSSSQSATSSAGSSGSAGSSRSAGSSGSAASSASSSGSARVFGETGAISGGSSGFAHRSRTVKTTISGGNTNGGGSGGAAYVFEGQSGHRATGSGHRYTSSYYESHSSSSGSSSGSSSSSSSKHRSGGDVNIYSHDSKKIGTSQFGGAAEPASSYKEKYVEVEGYGGNAGGGSSQSSASGSYRSEGYSVHRQSIGKGDISGGYTAEGKHRDERKVNVELVGDYDSAYGGPTLPKKEVRRANEGHFTPAPKPASGDYSLPDAACTRAGIFRHPDTCNKFYECYYDKTIDKFTLHLFECPIKLVFDDSVLGCASPYWGPKC